MNMFNVAKHIGKKKEDEEEELLCLWKGKDVVNKSSCLCVQWSTDGQSVAAGGSDGLVRMFDGKTGQFKGCLSEPPKDTGKLMDIINAGTDTLPIMALRWHPKQAGRIRVASSSGTIELLEASKKRVLQTTKEVDTMSTPTPNKPNTTLCIDYSADGSTWASGGTDKIVRVYDESQPKAPKLELRGSLAGDPGHNNRICAVRICKGNPSLIASAGLDGTALLWDTSGASGPRNAPMTHISDVDVRGDALDFDACDRLLTGSWRPGNQLQIWDVRSGKCEVGISWKKKPPPPVEAFPVQGKSSKGLWTKVRDVVKGSSNVYTCQYIGRGALLGGIVAGGTGRCELKVFTAAKEADGGVHTPIGSIQIPGGVQGLHVAPNNADRIAVAATDGTVYCVQMPNKPPKRAE